MKEVIAIRLPSSVKDDLDWSSERACAAQLVKEGRTIRWELDFDFASHPLRPRDTATFFANSRAIEEFTQQLWQAFKGNTSEVCLYRGSCYFEQLLDGPAWEEEFQGWSHGDYRLFCAQMFAEYLDRLISFFPDEIVPMGFFESDLSPATVAQLLSRERFQHLQCHFSGSAIEGARPSLGVCMPSDPLCNADVLAQLDCLFLQLQQQGTAYRLICEDKLAEEWDELDQLIVISDAVSIQGQRRLQGFCAAGGEVVVYKKSSAL